MLILLAEDDMKIAKMLIHLLSQDGYTVDHAKNGEEALSYIDLNHYELIILDWMMPLKSGIDVCSILRNNGYQGGIIMLTAKDSLTDKVTGLKTGADDYLVKPFEYQELLARLIALSRRSSKVIADDIVSEGPFSINRTTKELSIDHHIVSLSNREYQLFILLFDNRGHIVPRETIIDRVWGIDGDITDNNLDAYIRLLRKKIKPFYPSKVLLNIRSIGYKMEV